ncbi:DEBR0S1_01904g1_1 [Brettanomyces bruxellensis]|uniref:DEBR0S1_01904g1_1 n=1 Tax=Dekkera bruxellensis TaxID=5007 RepID=A0A7D9GY09_DEKBR|nr:DEBR0S1_01904g1_1 [Brettanomyces bruxellensis]
MQSFIVLLIVAALMIAVIVILPKISGVASYSRNDDYFEKKRKQQAIHLEEVRQKQLHQPLSSSTYIPPDEEEGYIAASSSVSKGNTKTGLKEIYHKVKNVKITEDDIPVKLHLLDKPGRTPLTNTATTVEDDQDPNKYDFDLQELIKEELSNDRS